MKICLINPPYHEPYSEGLEYCVFNQPVQHPGLGYIAAVLEDHGFEVDVIECPAQNITLNNLSKYVEIDTYDAIGISTYFFNFINVVRMVKLIKAIHPTSFLILGGYFPTLRTEEVFECIPNVDCCILGEGEITFLEIMESLRDRKDYRLVKGIAYKSDDKLIKTPSRELIKNIDELPLPKISYIKNGLAGITSTRGCYGSCTFCSVRKYYSNLPGPKIRRRSAKSVVDEIDILVNVHGVKYITFHDDNFLINSSNNYQRLEEFYYLLKEKQYNIKFRIFARANDIEGYRDLLLKLKEVGLELIFVGIESFVQRQLDLFNKKNTVEQNVTAINILNDIGIEYTIGLIIFEPYTTLDEILVNIKILQDTNYYKMGGLLNLPVSTYYYLMPLKDSPLYYKLLEDNLLSKNKLGFKFVNNDVQLFYEIKSIWSNNVEQITKLLYISLKAKHHNEIDLYNKLKLNKISLMKIDLDFMIELCNSIKTEKIHEVDSTETMQLVSKWLKLLDPIIEDFINAKELLKNYTY